MFKGQIIERKTGRVLYQSQPLPEFYLAYGVTDIELKTKFDGDSKKYRMKVLDTNRLFIGIYPCGIVYADKHSEEHGDYKRLAFLSYSSLVLELNSDCPEDLREEIIKDAKTIQDRKGEEFEISTCGQTVTLGGGL